MYIVAVKMRKTMLGWFKYIDRMPTDKTTREKFDTEMENGIGRRLLIV